MVGTNQVVKYVAGKPGGQGLYQPEAASVT